MININGFAEIEREINRAIPDSIKVQSSKWRDGKYYNVRIVVHGLTCHIGIVVHGLTCHIGMSCTNGICIDPVESLTDHHRVVSSIVSKYPYSQRYNMVALIRWVYDEVMSVSYNTLLIRCIDDLYPTMKQRIDADPLLYINYTSRRSTAYIIREYARSLLCT